jgi:hypothetical protein
VTGTRAWVVSATGLVSTVIGRPPMPLIEKPWPSDRLGSRPNSGVPVSVVGTAWVCWTVGVAGSVAPWYAHTVMVGRDQRIWTLTGGPLKIAAAAMLSLVPAPDPTMTPTVWPSVTRLRLPALPRLRNTVRNVLLAIG